MAHKCGEVTAVEARALGVHCVFAPVVDVNVNPDNPIINIRSFGSDPDEVSRLAVAWVASYQANGCLATAKHFPGHGDTSEDSHRIMPVVPHDLERMGRVELKPFQTTINAGVAAVMTAHIHFLAIDPTSGIPATLSRPILTDLLRGQMLFRGIVFTDAMAMWAIKHNFETGEAAVMAINAGADVLLADDPAITYDALWQAVQEGRLPMERVREAARRVLEAKEWCGLPEQRFVDESKVGEIIGCQAHQEVARQVAEASVTLVRNDGVVPVRRDAKLFVVIAETQRWTGEKPSDELAELLRQYFPNAVVHLVAPDPSAEQGDAVAQQVADGGWDYTLLRVFPRTEAYRPESAGTGGGMLTLAERLASHAPLAVTSFGSPYPLVRFGMAKAWLCAYSDAPASLRAGVKALFGELPAKGKLPVIMEHRGY